MFKLLCASIKYAILKVQQKYQVPPLKLHIGLLTPDFARIYRVAILLVESSRSHLNGEHIKLCGCPWVSVELYLECSCCRFWGGIEMLGSFRATAIWVHKLLEKKSRNLIKS